MSNNNIRLIRRRSFFFRRWFLFVTITIIISIIAFGVKPCHSFVVVIPTTSSYKKHNGVASSSTTTAFTTTTTSLLSSSFDDDRLSSARRRRQKQHHVSITTPSKQSTTTTTTLLLSSSSSSSSEALSSIIDDNVNGSSRSNDKNNKNELNQQYQKRMEETANEFIANFEYAWNQQNTTKVLDYFIEDYFIADEADNNNDNDDNNANQQQVVRPFWRDMVSFTWNICTMEGKQSIRQGLEHVFSPPYNKDDDDFNTNNDDNRNNQKPSSKKTKIQFQITSKPTPLTIIQNRIEFWCDLFIDNVGTGKAHFRIIQQQQKQNDGNKYKIQTLLTTLMELDNRPFQIGPNRIRGAIHGPIKNRKYWNERLYDKHRSNNNNNNDDYDDNNTLLQKDDEEKEENKEDSYYSIVIIGGGQAGLSLAARLQYMSIPYVVLESGSKPGIAWSKRYPSLHLHDPVWYNHMPYLPFPETWPVLCPRNKIADWMEFYAKVLDLHVMTNHKVISVTKANTNTNNDKISKEEEVKEWIVRIQETKMGSDNDIPSRDVPSDGDTESSNRTNNKKSTATATTANVKTIRARHVVFATGNSSHPRIPKLPGTFKGIQIHSSQYRGGREFANKKVVVVGSNNSAFDIVQDLWEQGAKSVAMIQRSPSLVVSTESVLKHGLGPLYREDAPLHHEDADLVATTMPYKMLIPRWSSVTTSMRETDAKLHQGLIDAGYRMDFGPDGTGVFAKSATEGGGFYINMGSAELFINGDVTIRYATVAELQNDGMVIVDKDTNQEDALPADVIVYATGFHTMDSWVADLCGEEISNQMGRTWGLGFGERPHKDPGPWVGELRNMWKPTTVDGLWFHGGNLAQSRHYSRFLALQLAARYIGMKTPVHGIPDPTPPPPSTNL